MENRLTHDSLAKDVETAMLNLLNESKELVVITDPNWRAVADVCSGIMNRAHKKSKELYAGIKDVSNDTDPVSIKVIALYTDALSEMKAAVAALN